MFTSIPFIQNDPGKLGNLVFWYDAVKSAFSTFAIDLSGKNNNPSIGASSPTLTGGVFAAKTKPGLAFASGGTNDLLFTQHLMFSSGFSAHITLTCNTVSSGVGLTGDNPFTICGATASPVISFGLNGQNADYVYGSNHTEFTAANGSAANNGVHTITVSHSLNGALYLANDGIITVNHGALYPTTTAFINAICPSVNGDNFNNGNIAEIMIWNSALSKEQIYALNQRSIQLWKP